jgi:hypothetical protein
MRTRTTLCLLAGCCAVLAGCAAGAPEGPDTTVQIPSVGKPAAPASAQTALSGEAFTSYAALGIAGNDGLAPGESRYSLAGPCMTAVGYPGVTAGTPRLPAVVPHQTLAFIQPWGGWGYLAITQDFANSTQAGPLAGIVTLGKDITSDVQNEPAVNAAVRAWSACMAQNGYSLGQPQSVFGQEYRAMYGGQQSISSSTQVSAAANKAQIEVAVTDADCTQASDLAGIYFAVQASYEQQLVTANQQALMAAVSRYRAAYAKELNNLRALLGTTKARPFRPAKPSTRRSGQAG